MPTKFLVTLTQVRPLSHQCQVRDEKRNPEPVLEAVATDEHYAAIVLFTSLCSLTPVRTGEQRSKLITLPGLDTDCEPAGWGAPLLTRAGSQMAGAR